MEAQVESQIVGARFKYVPYPLAFLQSLIVCRRLLPESI